MPKKKRSGCGVNELQFKVSGQFKIDRVSLKPGVRVDLNDLLSHDPVRRIIERAGRDSKHGRRPKK